MKLPNLIKFTPYSARSIPLFPKMSRPYNKDNNTKGRPRRNNRNDSPTVALSKQLSWLLRHNLDKSGLQARNDGYVRLDELVHLYSIISPDFLADPSQIPSIYPDSNP
jgi:RNA:NAD 2'-phosphotransferase (TPT1/KptA family)